MTDPAPTLVLHLGLVQLILILVDFWPFLPRIFSEECLVPIPNLLEVIFLDDIMVLPCLIPNNQNFDASIEPYYLLLRVGGSIFFLP